MVLVASSRRCILKAAWGGFLAAKLVFFGEGV